MQIEALIIKYFHKAPKTFEEFEKLGAYALYLYKLENPKIEE